MLHVIQMVDRSTLVFFSKQGRKTANYIKCGSSTLIVTVIVSVDSLTGGVVACSVSPTCSAVTHQSLVVMVVATDGCL